jgi:hypothetical protein
MLIDYSGAFGILRHLRERVREAGLASLDESFMSDPRAQDESPPAALLRYLEALDAELAVRSCSTVERTARRLSELTTGDSRVEGVDVRLTPRESDFANSPRELISPSSSLILSRNERHSRTSFASSGTS